MRSLSSRRLVFSSLVTPLAVLVLVSASARADFFSNVPLAERNGMQLLYDLNTPALSPDWKNANPIPYTTNNTATVVNNSFSRVGYYVELTSGAQNGQWVFVSMDAFDSNDALLGVPHNVNSAVARQTIVTNSNIYSSLGAIGTGKALAPINLEMWPSDYGGNAGATIPNGTNNFDYDDTGFSAAPGAAGGYGSFQIHNFRTGQTLFGFNRFAGNAGVIGTSIDIGLGNAAGANTDWTFATNGNTGRIQVVVSSDKFLTGTANWTSASWTGGTEPVAGDPANIGGGFTATVNSAGEVAHWLNVGHNYATSPGTGTLNITSGDLTVTDAMQLGRGGNAGTVTVSGGTLTAGSLRVGASAGGTSTLTVSGGTASTGNFDVGYNGGTGIVNVSSGTLNVGAGGTRVFIGGGDEGGSNGVGTGTLTISGTGIVNVAAAGAFPNDFIYLAGYGGTGTIIFNGGTLATARGIGSGGTGNITLQAGGGTIDDVGTAISIINVPIGGNGTLNKAGNGTLTLGGSAALTTVDTFTGTLNVNAGTLKISQGNDNNNHFAGNPNINVGNGATLSFNAFNAFGINPASMSAVTINSGGTMLASGDGADHVTVFNNFTLNNATATINSNDGFGANWGTFGFAGTTTATGTSAITLQAGKSGTIANANSVAPTFTVDTPAVADSLAISASIGPAGGNALAIVKNGSGTLRLTAANGYTGGTTLSRGTIVAANSSALSTSGTVTINNAGTGANNTSLLIDASGGSVNIGRPITVANQGSGVVTIGASNNAGGNQATFSGAITLNKDVTLAGGPAVGDRTQFSGGIGGTGNVTITGPQRVVFMTTANTYNGTTTVNAGAFLQLSDGTATATSFIPDSSNVTVNGTINIAKGNNSETIGSLAGTGTVQGHPSVPSVASTLIIGSGGGSATFNGVLADGGAAGASLVVQKTGTGTQELAGASPNTYSGVTTVSNGVLKISKDAALGTIAGNTSVTSGAALEIAGGLTYSTAEPLSLNGPGFGGPNTGAFFIDDGGTSSFAGPITIATNATIGAFNNSTLTLTGNINKNGTTVTFLGNGSATNFININGGVGPNALAASDLVVDNVSVNVNSAMDYAGPTSVQNNGILNINSGGSATTTSITVGSAGTGTVNQFTGGNTNVSGNVQVNAGSSYNQSGGTATVAGNAVVNGTYAQSGGVHVLTSNGANGNLNVNTGGAYNLSSNGTLDFRDTVGASGHHAGGGNSQINLTGTGAFNFTGGTLQDVRTINPNGTFTQSGGRFFIGQDEPGPGDPANPINNPTLPDTFARTTTINGGFSLLQGGIVYFDAFGAEVTPKDYTLDNEPIDLLVVTGVANLNGIFDFDDEYGAKFGDIHTLMLAPTINLGPNFAIDGGFFRVVPTGATGPGFALQAIVPEPASVAVWTIIGLVGMGGALRFRRQRTTSV